MIEGVNFILHDISQWFKPNFFEPRDTLRVSHNQNHAPRAVHDILRKIWRYTGCYHRISSLNYIRSYFLISQKNLRLPSHRRVPTVLPILDRTAL
jgi:hypothetical protein